MNSGLSKIAILGLGLIGGSLAAAFKRKKIGAEIVGIDQTSILEKALDKGLIAHHVKEPSTVESPGKNGSHLRRRLTNSSAVTKLV